MPTFNGKWSRARITIFFFFFLNHPISGDRIEPRLIRIRNIITIKTLYPSQIVCLVGSNSITLPSSFQFPFSFPAVTCHSIPCAREVNCSTIERVKSVGNSTTHIQEMTFLFNGIAKNSVAQEWR